MICFLEMSAHGKCDYTNNCSEKVLVAAHSLSPMTAVGANTVLREEVIKGISLEWAGETKLAQNSWCKFSKQA